MSNSLLLSDYMLQNEKFVAYSTSFESEFCVRNNVCEFTISTSESQGFAWNQDIFASQYQQQCKVIYDGHVDSVEKLIEKISLPSTQNELICSSVFHDDDTSRKKNIDEWNNRVSRKLNIPRRRSEHSISFVSDSKHGTFRVADVINIDVDSVTSENARLRRLVESL